MSKYICIFLCFGLFGCEPVSNIEMNIRIDNIQDIKYIKDKKVGLCFAFFDGGQYSVSEVPCDKVERILLNP